MLEINALQQFSATLLKKEMYTKTKYQNSPTEIGRNNVRGSTWFETDVNGELVENEDSERTANCITYYRDFATADFEERTYFFKDSDVVNEELNKR